MNEIEYVALCYNGCKMLNHKVSRHTHFDPGINHIHLHTDISFFEGLDFPLNITANSTVSYEKKNKVS
jgi:hypothetical protein